MVAGPVLVTDEFLLSVLLKKKVSIPKSALFYVNREFWWTIDVATLKIISSLLVVSIISLFAFAGDERCSR